MKTILIIYPHFPPSNLAGVHRPRLFAQHLPAYGWDPVILTVHEKYYEEALDYNLEKLLPATLRIEKVKAFRVTKPRVIGDIGLRAFFQLRKKALELIQKQKIDFVYIPIPSFYVSLIGPYLERKTGVKYGIDYIDPWVHYFPGSDKLFSRHWFSTKIAKWLEPLAVRNASLITGVAEGYYQGVKDRNPGLMKTCLFGAMPYGAELEDHKKLKDLQLKPYLFQANNKLQMVYAGAMLPKAYGPLEAIFHSIAENKAMFEETEFHFIGTGSRPNDATSYNIKGLAEKYGLWQNIIFEYPQRIPYLDVLAHLNAADAVFVLGSTESHYTPSKIYQGVLSQKPVLAVLHSQSTAGEVLVQTGAGILLAFNGENDLQSIESDFAYSFQQFRQFVKGFNPTQVNMKAFEDYSAKNVTGTLAALLNKAISG